MVVKSATKKWLMDGGMPELEAHILANNRRPYDDVFFGDERTMNKALVRMNYEEILDCLINNRLYKNSYPNMTPELYLGLSENLQRVRQYWLQWLEKTIEEYDDFEDIVHFSLLEDWDIEYESWKFIKWQFMNWGKNPFKVK